jgi:hypothetical protein
VFDFAVLSLRGVDTQTVMNFAKGAYLGADGTLLPVEAALPGLGRDEHWLVRDKLAAAVLGAGGAAEGGGEGAADSGNDGGSDSSSESDSGSALPTGNAALARAMGAQPPARRRGSAAGGGKAPGARQAGSPVPQLPPPPPPPQQLQLPSALPAKYRGGCMLVQAACGRTVLACARTPCRTCAPLGWHTADTVASSLRARSGSRQAKSGRWESCICVGDRCAYRPTHAHAHAHTYCCTTPHPRARARPHAHMLA